MVQWGFLIGFLPAWPFSVWAARARGGFGRPALRAFWLAAAFSAYFWTSGLVIDWKASLLGS
jgi:hypothetical protein